MLRYEMKKVFNKRINRILLTAAMLLMVIFSIFAIGSFRAVDANGETHTGLSAARLMIADKNRWQGELTPEVITNTVESSKSGDWQSTSDINYLASDMLVGEFFQRNFNTRRAPCSFPQGMDGAKLYAPKYLPG